MTTSVTSTYPPTTADRERRHELDPIFNPRSIAIIGATDRAGSVGQTVTVNLTTNTFGRKVFLVNPNKDCILDQPTYATIGAVSERVDLAVIVTPAKTVPLLIKECVAAGVRGAIIISAGFKELGPPGVELERQIRAEGIRRVVGTVLPENYGMLHLAQKLGFALRHVYEDRTIEASCDLTLSDHDSNYHNGIEA